MAISWIMVIMAVGGAVVLGIIAALVALIWTSQKGDRSYSEKDSDGYNDAG
jgi:hypothetical protein